MTIIQKRHHHLQHNIFSPVAQYDSYPQFVQRYHYQLVNITKSLKVKGNMQAICNCTTPWCCPTPILWLSGIWAVPSVQIVIRLWGNLVFQHGCKIWLTNYIKRFDDLQGLQGQVLQDHRLCQQLQHTSKNTVCEARDPHMYMTAALHNANFASMIMLGAMF